MKKAPNGEGSVYYENNTDRYVFSYTDQDGQRRRKRFKTRKEADKAKRETLTSMDRGEYVEPSALTLTKWLDTWVQEYAAPCVRASTLAAHKDIIRLHLAPAFPKMLLQGLRTEHIQAFINRQVRQGFAPATVKRQMATLKTALKQAVKNQLIMRNPAEYVNMPKMEQKEIKSLTIEEVIAPKSVIPDDTEGRALLFILGTGLRVSEACGLRWCDVSAEGISVNQITYTLNKKRIYEAPKTKAGKRFIPLTDKLYALLDTQRQSQRRERVKAGAAWQGGEPCKREQPVFATELGTPADRSNIGRKLRACLDAAGLEHRGVHALRHTFASIWVQSGVDVETLSEMIGHTKVAFTMQTYVHSNTKTKRKAMEIMSEYL
jgi:integrase